MSRNFEVTVHRYYQLFQLLEQDEGLDLILSSVQRQKTIAGQIGEETDAQIQLLDKLDAKVDDSVNHLIFVDITSNFCRNTESRVLRST